MKIPDFALGRYLARFEFSTRLRETEGALLLPGDLSGHPGNHFRIGFGRRSFPEALERLERFVEREPRRA